LNEIGGVENPPGIFSKISGSESIAASVPLKSPHERVVFRKASESIWRRRVAAIK
jgi:hypothetical protein